MKVRIETADLLKAIQECCKLETEFVSKIRKENPDISDIEIGEAFVSKIRKENPDISDIEIGVHMGLLEKADRIMAIIKREEVGNE